MGQAGAVSSEEVSDATGSAAVAHAFARMAELCGGRFLDADGILLYRTVSREAIVWNGALLTTAAEDPAPAVARADQFFAAEGCEYGFWVVGKRDAALASYLQSQGRSRAADDAHMSVRSAALTATGRRSAEFKVVSTDADRRRFVDAATRSFAGIGVAQSTWSAVYATLDSVCQPDVITVVGGEGGAPCAVAMAYVKDRVCEVIHVGTVPEARRRGLGAMVTAAVIDEATTRGARLAVLQSTEMGEGVYRRLGFREIDRYGIYVRNPSQ